MIILQKRAGQINEETHYVLQKFWSEGSKIFWRMSNYR